MSDRKRSAPQDSQNGDTPTKKVRTDGPAPAAAPASIGNHNQSLQDKAAAMRAQVAAKFAKFQRPGQSGAPGSASQPPPQQPGSGAASSQSLNTSNIARQIAEGRRRVEEAAKAKQATSASSNPYLGGGQASAQSVAAARAKVLAEQGRDGKSGSGIHPLLMDMGSSTPVPSSSKDRYKPMLPKFASTKANERAAQSLQASRKPQQLDLKARGPTLEEARADPHFDRRLGLETLAPRQKKSRPTLHFNQRGKFVRMAESIRQEERMEALKARIAEAARKTGMEEDLEADGGLGRRIKKQPPPAVEWWDVAFVEGESYDDLDSERAKNMINQGCSDLVQHPIPIPAPGDRRETTVRPLMLTKKERKKMRRIRRAEALRDHQDRVKMGLLPPDPPKVKLTNMMRVLTQEAVADPTKIEARVRREMNARQAGHDKMNAERKLTHEQRRQKHENKAREDEAKGLHAAAFRVKHLTNPLHNSKVRLNAEQLYLTGACVYSPRFALVLVEGSAKAVKKYKKLMLQRIDWTEESISYTTQGDDEEDDAAGGSGSQQQQPKEPVNMAENECVLVWEGEHRDRLFSSFRRKQCPTDHMAREFLGPKAEGYYDFARKSAGMEVGL